MEKLAKEIFEEISAPLAVPVERTCKPEYLGRNTAIGCRNGECKCGNIVRSYQKYCDECGAKLNWEGVGN